MTILDRGRTAPAVTSPRAASDAVRLGEYLRARRAVVLPSQVGLAEDRRRRVEGLRRQEVAQLAGISPEYYLRLEQGRGGRPSAQVLSALGRALRLDAYAVEYLHRLGSTVTVAEIRSDRPRRAIEELLEPWGSSPVVVLDPTQTVVAANASSTGLGDGLFDVGRNVLRELYRRGPGGTGDCWDPLVGAFASALRFHAAPDDAALHELLGELLLTSAHFRGIWSRHDARPHTSGRWEPLERPAEPRALAYQAMHHAAFPGSTILVFYAAG